MAYNDIKNLLERLGVEKHLRTEMTAAVGLTDVINEDRMQKLERNCTLSFRVHGECCY